MLASFKLVVLLSVVALACAWPQFGSSSITTFPTTSTIPAKENSQGQTSKLDCFDHSIIRNTWDQAKKNGEFAPRVLLRFIKAHPEYQQMFAKFASVPHYNLLRNGDFLAQAYTILAGLNVVIQSLSSQELLAAQFNLLGSAYQPRGVTPAMFKEFGVIIEQVLEETLGSTFNVEARKAWNKGMVAIIAGISKTLKNPEDLADAQSNLSRHQIRNVQRSWESMKSGRNALVSAIFIKLFKETPRVQKHFTKFANVPVDSLRGNGDYIQQVALVADRLDTIISAMDDQLQLLGNINYLKYTHAKRSIPRKTWEDFARLLVELLPTRGVSASDMESWKGVTAVFVNGIAPKN
ncbi:uncharacterized protein LOC124205470 [Daphnia pulex]|uniref:uncharacterized protein LOC124205470 n=1 Tax=Daphnia pulex TaxID=6669 RepID=UPI001EDDABBC|nr:uncharacterized protein LOC124205470 [Daphnia pulex]